MQQATESITGLQAHATISSLLARALNYPDATLVKSLTSGEFAHRCVESLDALGHNAAAGEIQTLIDDYDNGGFTEAELLLDLERDYTRLFFASKPRLVYLFESVYREGRLLQESTFEVARLYRDAGLVLNDDFALPPDHIAVELEFLSFLYFKEIDGLKQNKEDAVEYACELRQMLLDGHLKPFAKNIADRLEQHAKCALYKAAAQLMRSYFG